MVPSGTTNMLLYENQKENSFEWRLTVKNFKKWYSVKFSVFSQKKKLKMAKFQAHF